ncbi:MAG: 3-isopropylmalate dehydratase large subunit [Planctomycetota bacterium]
MPGTVSEKVLGHLAGRPVRPGEIVTVEPHVVMSHDNTSFIVDAFRETGYPRVWDPERLVVIFDHCVPATDPRHAQNHRDAADFAREQGLPHFFGTTAGVCHQVMCERGFALPGTLVLGADSHSTLYGALGAFGVPINRTEMAGVWATGEIWLKVPESLRIQLSGRLRPGVSAKDLVLRLLRELRADGAAYQTLEFHGPAVAGLSISERMTLCNMAVELGAKAGIVPADARTLDYLRARRGTPEARAFPADWEQGLARAVPDPDARYAQTHRVDLDALEPQVACPHTVDNVTDLSAVAGTAVHQGYLGSCTNGRLEDLALAADVVRGRTLQVPLYVYPASVEVLEQAEAQGVLSTLRAAGAEVMTASCGPCFGTVGATLGAGQVCISSSNRNFQGRMGHAQSEVYLSSPAVVAASCLAGEIADARPYLEGA